MNAWACTALLLVAAGGVAGAQDGPPPVEAEVERLVDAAPETVVAAFGSVRPIVRQAAATVVGRRGAASPREVRELIAATGDEVIAVRMAATRSLGKVGDAAVPAVARLERLAGWATAVPQRTAAVLSLADIPGADEALLRVFRDDGQRDKTLSDLAAAGPDGRALLVRLAATPDWRVRRGALDVLPSAAGADDSAPVREVVQACFDDESCAVRVAAWLAAPPLGLAASIRAEHVERAFGEHGEDTERRAVVVALAGADGDAAVRSVAITSAASTGSAATRLAAVRLANATRTWDEASLRALAAIAGLPDVGPAREAGAALRLVDRPLSDDVATALRPALAHESSRVASEAAAALALRGHDGPELAAPLARLLIAHSPGGWTKGWMSVPPRYPGRRSLRAGGPRRQPGEVVIPALPQIPLITRDDLPGLLRAQPSAAVDALVPLLDHEWAVTRYHATWTLAEVAAADDVAEHLTPLLRDADERVRVVAAVRLDAAVGPHGGAARTLVALLVAQPSEESLLDDPVIRADGRSGPLIVSWDDGVLAAIARSPDAAVDELLRAHDAAAPTGLDYVRRIVTRLGADGAHRMLRNAVETERADSLARLYESVGGPDTATRAALQPLRDDPELGGAARRILD